MDQSGAEASRMEACHLYLVACWCHSSACKYAKLDLHRNSPGAAIWIWYVAGFYVLYNPKPCTAMS